MNTTQLSAKFGVSLKSERARPQNVGRANLKVCCSSSQNSVSLKMKRDLAAASLAGMLCASSAAPALAVDEAVLIEKGHAFAEASADVLRAMNKGVLTDAINAATKVAFSVDPIKALTAVDAGLEALITADVNELAVLVKTAEAATTASIEAGKLIPANADIDAVVDEAAKVAGTVDPEKLAAFSKVATDAALSADPKTIAGLTGVGVKVGFAVGPPKLAAATKAAGELVLALN